MRVLVAAGGIATASAVLTALLPSVAPWPATVDAGLTAEVVAPAPSVRHVTRIVVLKPGETAPPQASVIVQPTPTPRVRVVTTTRQSGTP
ncbi:MAG TPA: hypothetical protein VGK16_09140 [Candidatus Limnocylindrales bacterium]